MPINSEFNQPLVPFLVPDMPKYEEYAHYLAEVDHNRWYSNFGPLLEKFEQGITQALFSEETDIGSRVVSCSSGTSALELALLSLKLPRGSKILIPSFTFAATATAVIRVGYEPVFADVDPYRWMLTPEIAVEAMAHTNIKAVIPVCTFGCHYDRSEWEEFTLDIGIPVVIDAAAAIQAQQPSAHYHTCYSLHATKYFGVGEGGLVIAPDQCCADKIRELSNFGFSNGLITQVGSNYKMSEYHAAIGLAQLKRVELLKEKRNTLKNMYRKHFSSSLHLFSVQNFSGALADVTTLMPSGFQSAAAVVIKPELKIDGERITRKLCDAGVASRRWYTPGLHKHPAFIDYTVCGEQGRKQLPVTEMLNGGMVGLPYHNFLNEESIGYIANILTSSIDMECRLRAPYARTY